LGGTQDTHFASSNPQSLIRLRVSPEAAFTSANIQTPIDSSLFGGSAGTIFTVKARVATVILAAKIVVTAASLAKTTILTEVTEKVPVTNLILVYRRTGEANTVVRKILFAIDCGMDARKKQRTPLAGQQISFTAPPHGSHCKVASHNDPKLHLFPTPHQGRFTVSQRGAFAKWSESWGGGGCSRWKESW
jgi:hypothetical protein